MSCFCRLFQKKLVYSPYLVYIHAHANIDYSKGNYMANTKIIISSPAGTKEAIVYPAGVTLGRSVNCDIILGHDNVSRQHARISQDPFGRWIIEDLKSHNGIFINGKRIEALAIQPGQEITIPPFTLSLKEESDRHITSLTTVSTAISVIDKGLEENIVAYRADKSAILSPDLMQHLNELTGRLLELSNPAQLYTQACLSLAGKLDTLVAIVRLPNASNPLPPSPEILACNFGSAITEDASFNTSGLHFSKRVLEAVRSKDAPVMASSGPTGDKRLALTVVDTHKPHIVFAARVNEFDEMVDALYIDVLEDKSAKEMFDFVEAIARQLNFAQKSLFLTELKKQEQALREANVQLKEKDRVKDEYVSRVTHDIKGHLSAIQSCLHIGTDKAFGTLNDKQADFLKRASKRTAQLTDFVKELLNLTKMRLSGEFETAPFSLPSTIEKSVTAAEQKANDKSITLTYNIDPSIDLITGNQFSINEVITNLLFNAVKYTPEGKTVHLEAKNNEDDIQLDFTDTGIGIPAGEITNVFDEFFRATNAKESAEEGTGLGLSIVKQIVERHGGQLSVTSDQGQGSTFTVILPKNTFAA
jgi:signal transduction histidine kinase